MRSVTPASVVHESPLFKSPRRLKISCKELLLNKNILLKNVQTKLAKMFFVMNIDEWDLEMKRKGPSNILNGV